MGAGCWGGADRSGEQSWKSSPLSLSLHFMSLAPSLVKLDREPGGKGKRFSSPSITEYGEEAELGGEIVA